MNVKESLARLDLNAIQQTVKWIVYAILVVNFFFYFLDDMEEAEHSLRNGGSFMDWVSMFTTTIDELAWFALLFLFELETYSLSDKAFAGITGKLVHGVRLVCYVFLANTIYAYSGDVIALGQEEPIPGVSSLCEFTDQEISYTYNLEYTVIDDENCAALSSGTVFFHVDSESLVTDSDGIEISRWLAWIDLVEAIVWLLIVFLIEFMVRMQNRGITDGPWIRFGNVTKPLLYGFLLLLSVYWALKGHWLYVWDEFIWIAGFIAIEMNVVDWREEIREEKREDDQASQSA